MNNKIVKNASWIVGCKIGQSVLQLIIGMISARYLGPSNYGLIGSVASVIAFVVPIMQLGLSKTLVKEIIERPKQEGEVLGTALVMNLVSAVACMVSVYIFLVLSNPGETLTIIVGVLCSISLLFQSTEILIYWFQAKLLSKYTSIASLIAYVVAASYKIYLLITQKPITWFALCSGLDYLIVSVVLFLFYKKLGSQRLRFSFSLSKKMFDRSKHYIISSMMVTIFQQTDRIMLKLMLNETETGYYSAAITCVGVTGFVFVAIIDSFRPEILEASKSNNVRFESEMKLLYTIITYLALAQSIAMTILAKPIVLILYGSEYMASVAPLQIAVWYTTFSYYGSVRNIWILAENKQKYLWIINLSGATANVVINAILIPSLGAVGAAIASLATQFFTNVIIGFIIKPIRYNNKLMIAGLNPKPLIAFAKQILNKKKRKAE